jgi:cellulose biosynthesis protein BcsQ
MRVIALASQKGGTGKTTLAGHLAVQAHMAGAGPVVLLDTDNLGTLADWWDARPADDLAFVESHMARLAGDLTALREDGFRLAMIDTPAGNPMAIQTALQQADLVVVPVRVGPHDLKAIGFCRQFSIARQPLGRGNGRGLGQAWQCFAQLDCPSLGLGGSDGRGADDHGNRA